MLFLNFVRQNLYFILGSVLGLLLSLIIIPVIESNNECLLNLKVFNANHEVNDVVRKIEDEYEPQINLAGKPLKAQKVPQQLIRPRYFSTELGIKQKLLVSILSSSTSVQTNSIAINKTIAHLTEKIIFFVDTSNKLNISKLNMPDIVAFIDSRHILKPFHIFKYLIDNYLLEFDYFFFINDSSYINFRKLYNIVNKISVRETLYFGEKIDKSSQYCSLNAGILLSNSVLKALSSNIDWCIKNIDSDSNDINIGRCILHSVNVPCISDIMGQTYSSFNILQNTNVKYELQYLKKQTDFNTALTIHPVIKESYFYILHAYFTRKGLESDLLEIKRLRKSIEFTASQFSELKQNLTWPIGNQPGNKPHSRFDVLYWKYFTNSSLYLKDDYTTVSVLSPLELADIQNVLQNSVQFINNKYSGKLQFNKLINGYKRFDLSRGMDYILDLSFRNVVNNKNVIKRVQICKPLGKIDILKIPYVTENTRINIILPVQHNDVNATLKYLQQYKKTCMEKKEKTFLMLILLYEPHLPGKDSKHDVYKQVKEKCLRFTKDFRRDNNKVSWLSIKLPKNSSRYTGLHDYLLTFAILDLVLKKFSIDSLIFYTSPNTEIFNDFLNRIRMNTINGYQVFNPIPFNEYNPTITQRQGNSIDINKSMGHFNAYSNEHVSFYVKDYTRARENIAIKIPRVHNDKDILNLTRAIRGNDTDSLLLVTQNIVRMFESSANVHVLKATEPNLRVFYKQLRCEYREGILGQKVYERCLFLRNYNLGSRSQLSKNVLQYISKIF